MSFSDQAVAFFLDVDASMMRQSFKDGKRDYNNFVKDIDRLNTKLVNDTTAALNKFGENAKGIIVNATEAVAAYEKARVAVQKAVRPIRQPIEFVASAGGGLKQAFEQALSGAKIRLTTARPLKRNPLFDQKDSMTASYRKMPQPPDYVGTFSTQQRRFAHGGQVPRVFNSDNAPRFGDRMRVGDLWINPTEHVTPDDVIRDILASQKDILRRLAEFPRSLEAQQSRLSRSVMGNQQFMEALTELRNIGRYVAGVGAGHAQGMSVSASFGVEGLKRVESQFGRLSESLALFDPKTRSKIEPYLKSLNHELDTMSDTLRDIAINGAKIEKVGGVGGGGAAGARRGHFLARVLGDPMEFMASSVAIKNIRGAGIHGMNILGGAPSSQEQFARTFAQHGGGSMQGGRELFDNAWSRVGRFSGVQESDIANAMYAAQQHGFRGVDMSTVGSQLAAAARAGGVDPGSYANQLASLSARGLNSTQINVLSANMLHMAKASGVDLGSLSNITGGAGADLVAATGLRGEAAYNLFSGVSGITANILAKNQGPEGQQAAATLLSLMQGSSTPGSQGAMTLAALGINAGSFQGQLKSGDLSGALSSLQGGAASWHAKTAGMSTMAREAFAQSLGLGSAAEFEKFLSIIKNVNPELSKLAFTTRQAAQANAYAAAEAGRATNITDKIRGFFDAAGSYVNSATGGLAAGIAEMPWGTALSGAYMINNLSGGMLTRGLFGRGYEGGPSGGFGGPGGTPLGRLARRGSLKAIRAYRGLSNVAGRMIPGGSLPGMLGGGRFGALMGRNVGSFLPGMPGMGWAGRLAGKTPAWAGRAAGVLGRWGGPLAGLGFGAYGVGEGLGAWGNNSGFLTTAGGLATLGGTAGLFGAGSLLAAGTATGVPMAGAGLGTSALTGSLGLVAAPLAAAAFGAYTANEMTQGLHHYEGRTNYNQMRADYLSGKNQVAAGAYGRLWQDMSFGGGLGATVADNRKLNLQWSDDFKKSGMSASESMFFNNLMNLRSAATAGGMENHAAQYLSVAQGFASGNTSISDAIKQVELIQRDGLDKDPEQAQVQLLQQIAANTAAMVSAAGQSSAQASVPMPISGSAAMRQ